MSKLTNILFSNWLTLVLLFSCNLVIAQTGIGTTTPHASAKLDVSSTNKGFLPPRVTLTSATDITTITSPAEGLFVYNLGSVGLQAGYYYWNGANWATIATATSAGNGVTASDMVKIYDGIGNAATINSTGATFSVTTSGKYLFDFSTSATCGNCTLILNFQVRDGSNNNSVIASDMQTSYSNNVHAEYNGKVEANLIAGRSYNVLVTASSGGIYGNDYTRVYMKQVSGNLPVTGQTVDYIQASLSSNQSLTAAGNIIFNSSSGTGISLTSGGFELKANKTYKLEAALGGSSTGYGYYAWVDNTNTLLPGSSVGVIMKAGNTYSDAPQDKAVVYFTPSTNTTVFLRVLNISGTVTAYAPPAANNYSSTWATIQQIGSSAIVNPWVLSGNDVYNTTGEVGIGTATPAASAILDLTSTSKGILIPRMTAAQKNAIASPSTGLLLFQTDAPAGFYYYNGSAWLNIANLGTSNRYIPYSSNFAFYTTGQSLTSAASGNNIDLTGSDLEIIVPSGFSSNRIVLNWDTWGDLSTTNTAHGSLRYAISQSGAATSTYYSVAMNGWATIATGSMRFATPVSYILYDLAPGTYTFKLRISREGESGTINSINNYHVAGTGQVYVK